jgi:UDP-N-acetyl-2-amino-2-deoxyglucuronate dehydrogenase
MLGSLCRQPVHLGNNQMKHIPVGVITNDAAAHLSAYFEALAKTEEVETVVVADPSGKSFDMARQALGTKLQGTFPDTRAMLQAGKPVLALVSLEAVQAPPEIDAALEAGCHVYAEKPACVNPADFERLVKKADSKHLHLMLALANRLNSPVREARRLLRAGKFGKIYSVEMHIVADQTRLKRPEYHQSWFASKARAGGGHLIWLGLHWLDLATYLTGLEVSDVCALTEVVGGQPLDVEDAAALVLRFDNGSLGTLTSGYFLDKGYHTHIKIWCEHGWLELSGRADGLLEYYTTKGVAEPKVQRFDPATGESGYTPFVRAAVRAAAGLDEPPITGQEGLRVLQTVFAAYRAAETGQRQKV